MPTFRYRDEDSTSEGLLFLAVGALAGIAAGAYLAQKYGGFGAITSRLRDRLGGEDDTDEFESDEFEGDESEDGFGADLSPAEELEERVLEAYHNDPVLSERAIDIGAIDDGIIELTGWVNSADEAQHAVTVARGTPGVDTVVNRLAVRAEEEEFDDTAERYAAGDSALHEPTWEGMRVGTGRPRQGNSGEPGRHANPKPPLESRWMNEEEAYKEAADPVEGTAERRQRNGPKGGETDGSPVSPSGVPKADHVVDAEDSPQAQGTGDTKDLLTDRAPGL